jgi:hypothetical protein
MSNKKRYILTIEFNTDEDRCEFIEEKLIEETTEAVTLGTIDLNDYFSESDMICILEHNVGKS